MYFAFRYKYVLVYILFCTNCWYFICKQYEYKISTSLHTQYVFVCILVYKYIKIQNTYEYAKNTYWRYSYVAQMYVFVHTV